ncbi:lanthionine synthetase C family protein [Burkholderia alba]|uniref:lanthionine synthetase C family protein n=1 Tax=Burkholderia alba TaxID=2683677 RepID=UPI002B0551D0|nr:LanC-like protein [Burkholderia alba]
MLFDSARHEALTQIDWDEGIARQTIARIVADTRAKFDPETYWPAHPLDDEGSTATLTPLYHGAGGVFWALAYLESTGAASPGADLRPHYAPLLSRNRAWLQADTGHRAISSYLMGDTPILMLDYGRHPSAALAERIATLIEANLNNPTRELMWGSPGTLLAARFLHERDGDARWAELFRRTADTLWSALLWSPEHHCHYWRQDLYGSRFTFLDGVHGFVATAAPLIAGRHLLDDASWEKWRACIVNTIGRTAVSEGGHANWPVMLYPEDNRAPAWLMQFCHGAPGFVICLAQMPDASLDALLQAAGEAIWAAGPLRKGSNLCHGTGGNGYAFLALYRRTGDATWLDRARAFAMHGIAQTDAAQRRHGQLRYSLWTGDPGFAIFLWDCVQGTASFPTLDVFYGAAAR